MKRFLISLLYSTTLIMGILSVSMMSTSPVHAAPCTFKTQTGLADNIFVPWYKYLKGDDASGRCTPSLHKDANGDTDWGRSISLIGVAIIELLTRISGLIAIGFVVWGGIQYTTSQGEPEGINNAKSTITNALIGLVIVFLSVGILQFIGGVLQ